MNIHPSPRIARIALLAWIACMLGSALAAQVEPPTQQPRPQDGVPQDGQQQDGQQGPKKLEQWPALKRPEADRVRSLTTQFRKPQQELRDEAHKQLVAIGAGAAPILIPMVTDRAESINADLFSVLDVVVDVRHSALLARETGRHSVEWRRYLMQRLCRFGDASLLPVLEKALGDKDEHVVFTAALGLLALERTDGLDVVLVAARQRWHEVGSLVADVLPKARSAECANAVFEKIAAARPTDQMAGLRLLRYLMVKDQGVVLRTYLESSDFTVKREAINAARVLHGEPPLEKLASFQAIEMAQHWLKKL